MEDNDLIGAVLKWVHVNLVIIFTIGIAEYVTYFYQAARETEPRMIHEMAETGEKIHNYFLKLGGSLLFISGVVTAWRHGVPMLGFLQGGDVNWLLVSIVLFLTYFPIMFLVFVPRHKVFHHELDKAMEKGEITEGLRKVFISRGIRFGHIYEAIYVFVIVFLMVVKPF
jgi:hypothetical protein